MFIKKIFFILFLFLFFPFSIFSKDEQYNLENFLNFDCNTIVVIENNIPIFYVKVVTPEGVKILSINYNALVLFFDEQEYLQLIWDEERENFSYILSTKNICFVRGE